MIEMQRLEIAADGDRFSEHRTVITHHRCSGLIAVQAAGRRCRLPRSTRSVGMVMPFFREEYPHARYGFGARPRRHIASSPVWAPFPNSLTPLFYPGRPRRLASSGGITPFSSF